MTAQDRQVAATFPSEGLALPDRPGLAAAMRGAVRRAVQRLSPRSLRETWDAPTHSARSFRPARGGIVLRCRAGLFLVTQAGDPLDHLLAAGDAWVAARRGRIAAWALQAGSLELTRPHAPRAPVALDGQEPPVGGVSCEAGAGAAAEVRSARAPPG